MDQKIEALSEADAVDVRAKREWVRGFFVPEAQHLYDELDQKLILLDGILKNKWIAPTETLKLQCLGITWGDALAQKLGLEWVAVEDEHGRDPALRAPGTTLLLFPLTMISKRVERGEEVNVFVLFRKVCELAEAKKNEVDPI
ncbi:MAG: DUF3806 domain-containing protein [Planctomycetes bacterium]|nr:DUF3806 domain-containing protein [Planctomycetota bacterium]